jgi:tetratricopeptide (TPR) repeat protein
LGEEAQSEQYYQKGGSASPDYCFPFRLESQKVLNHVLQIQPDDDRAHYYLGNLMYYYKQPEKAIGEWEASKELNDDYPYVLRNLGMTYQMNKNNLKKSVEHYEQAIQTESEVPRLFAELAAVYKKAEIAFPKRLQLFEANKEVIELRDDALSQLIQVYIQVGRYDEAIEYLKNHHFRRWEGGGDIRTTYVDAYLMRGLNSYHDGSYEQALQDFNQALKYPENIQAAQSYHGGRQAQIHYFAGMTCEAMNKPQKAKRHFKEAVSTKKRGEATEIHYYEARALQKLGMKQKSHEIFLDILQNGNDKLDQTSSMSFFAKFGEQQSRDVEKANAHYLIGLGYLGAGNENKAREEFKKALDLDMDHLWARYYLTNE